MTVYSHGESVPRLGDGVFVAPGARVIGDVDLGTDSSVWFNAVIRGDVHAVRVGARTTIQDGAVLHVTHRRHDLEIGRNVVIGHAAILHGCRVGDGALIGMGSLVLDGAVVEEGAQVAAGALVSPGSTIPSGSLAVGVPARITRRLAAEALAEVQEIVGRYVNLKNEYGRALGWGRETVEKMESS